MKETRSKTTHFLWGSLIAVALLCIAVFSFLTIHMGKVSARTLKEVGTLYMSGMSEQISQNFETSINLRLTRMDALVSAVVSDDIHRNETQKSNLISSAKALGFEYMGFYLEDGSFDMLFGSELTVGDQGPFMTSLSNKENKVSVGTDAQGTEVILLGIPAHHAPTREHPCVALVGAMPLEYITDPLSLDENSSQVYSFIIRRDGSYVAHGSDAVGENYFDRVRTRYDRVGDLTPEEYLDELTQIMERNEEYSNEFVIDGELRHLYCTHLNNTEWYLLTFMPYNTMDSILDDLNQQWCAFAIAAAVVILLAILLVFAGYFRLTRRQMRELSKAWRDADAATRAKSEFLSNMSHDIRTPMNAIVGMTAIATTNIDNKEQVQNCLKKISLSSKHLLGLINDVLDMSKIESGKMTLSMDEVSLREVMESIVSIVQPQVRIKNQQFSVSIHDISAENVYCDSVRLNQVLLNLLSNAIKFTPDGGAIRVSLFEEPSPKGDDFVRIHVVVADNGIGMTPEFKEKIFESFTREDSARVRHTEGTGLGMAITKYIVDAMEGTIQVDSRLGEGSEFRVTLDMEKAAVPEQDMLLPDWNMLVVDDDSQLCESAVSALKSIGVNAEWTLDGESAMELVQQRHDRREDYHIILLDWKLPGIDGIETARRIRQSLGEDVPILLISAYDWAMIEDEAKAAGINGFISKPLFKSTLYHGLKQYAQDGAVPNAVDTPARADLSGRRVLLAEDNELNWEIANELLSAEGLTLDWAENGQICVDMLQKSPPGYYDAVLMDLRMPVMTGYEAARAIRALQRPDADLPIIAMTADAFAEDVQRCLDCGMNGHVAKPIDVDEVLRLLERAWTD